MLPEAQQIVPNYFLLREIGEGGTGIVYDARHRSDSLATEQGEVAIKVLNSRAAPGRSLFRLGSIF